MKKKIFTLFLSVILACLMCIPVMANTSLTLGGQQVATIVPTGTEKVYNFSYSATDKAGVDEYNDEVAGQVIEIKMTAPGRLYVNVNVTSANAKSMAGALYVDKACTKKVTYFYLSTYSGKWADSEDVYLPAGTYYLRLSSDLSKYSENNFQNSGTLGIKFISAADRTLKAGASTTIASDSNGNYIKVVAPKDGLITITGNQNTDLQLYNSKKKKVANADGYLSKNNKYKNQFQVKKGTYYVWSKSYSDTYVIKYQFSGEPSLAAGKTLTLYRSDTKHNYYVKIKPSKTGYITLTTGKKLYGNVAICNSKKKAISKECTLNGSSSYYNKVVFAVKKNTTYYIKVRSIDYIYQIKYSVKGVSEKSGSKMSKPVYFKKGKSVSGLILPGESKKDYYAIKLTKAEIVKFKITGNVSSGYIKVNIYGPKKKFIGSKYISDVGYSSTVVSASGINLFKAGKWPKGTYYIEVARYDANSNGSYGITWLKK